MCSICTFLFFFNDTATTWISTYRHTLSLPDALPILLEIRRGEALAREHGAHLNLEVGVGLGRRPQDEEQVDRVDRGHFPGSDPAFDDGGLVGHRPAELAGQVALDLPGTVRSEEHTSELQSLMRI